MILDEDLPQNVRRAMKTFLDASSCENGGSRVTYQPQSDTISRYMCDIFFSEYALNSFSFNV